MIIYNLSMFTVMILQIDTIVPKWLMLLWLMMNRWQASQITDVESSISYQRISKSSFLPDVVYPNFWFWLRDWFPLLKPSSNRFFWYHPPFILLLKLEGVKSYVNEKRTVQIAHILLAGSHAYWILRGRLSTML